MATVGKPVYPQGSLGAVQKHYVCEAMLVQFSVPHDAALSRPLVDLWNDSFARLQVEFARRQNGLVVNAASCG